MTQKYPNIAIIGAGNMGSSLIQGLIRANYPASALWAAEPDQEKRAQLEREFAIHTTESNIEAVNMADAIILAVKPQYIASVVTKIAPAVQSRKPLIISIAAGIPINNIQTCLK